LWKTVGYVELINARLTFLRVEISTP